jgi:alpha-L-arabinofuranosidase
MFAKHFQNRVVQTYVHSPSFSTRSIGWADATQNVPYVEATSSINDAGTAMTVIVINKHFDRGVRLNLGLTGFETDSGGARIHTLSGSAIDANPGVYSLADTVAQAVDERFNDGGPGEISLKTESVDIVTGGGSTLLLELPARSVTAVVLQGRPVPTEASSVQ